MKYCVSIRQTPAVLRKADEIKVEFKDVNKIPELCQEFSDKDIIFKIPKEGIANWSDFSKFNNLIMCLEDIKFCKQCRNNNIKFYWAYPITSYYELNALADLGVSQFLLGAPLYFDLQCIKNKYPTRDIRLVANKCFDDYIPQINGIKGTYVRPEDVKIYEEFVTSLEFYSEKLSEEAELLKIYKEDRTWPGNLRFLFHNFNYDVDNRAIPEQLGEARMHCQQSCMRRGSCNFCYTGVKFSRTLTQNREELLKKLK